MKIYKKIAFWGVFVGLLSVGCTQKSNIVIERAEQKLNIQAYTDTMCVKHVVLEITPESIIGRVKQLLVTDSCIFIVNHQPNVIYMFGRDGKFLRQIGSLGRGPDEYLNAGNIDVDESKREITIYDNRLCRAMTFDYNGQHLASFENEDSPCGEIVRLGDTLYALTNTFNDTIIKQNPRVLILSNTGKIVNTFIPQPEMINKEIIVPVSDGFFTKNSGGCYYIPNGTDKIYRLSPDGQNELITSLGIEDGMLPMDISQDDYEKMRAVKFGPLSNFYMTDEGIFTTCVNFDSREVQIIGSLKDGMQLVGWTSALASAWPGLISARTSYRDYFVGLMSAAEASQFHDKFPDMAEDANPVVIFFKYKLK